MSEVFYVALFEVLLLFVLSWQNTCWQLMGSKHSGVIQENKILLDILKGCTETLYRKLFFTIYGLQPEYDGYPRRQTQLILFQLILNPLKCTSGFGVNIKYLTSYFIAHSSAELLKHIATLYVHM